LKNISTIHKDYSKAKLSKRSVNKDPITQFNKWMEEAINSEVSEPTAMVLATSNKDGQLSSRTVLLKEVWEGSFVFYTNFNSRKGQDLAQHPVAALTFLWPELERQVNIRGSVHKVSEAKSDEYFQTRPRKHRIGAWASRQSEELESNNALVQEFLRLTVKYGGKKVPRPPHWGGYGVLPHTIQFWQGRPSRLHDRIEYSVQKSGIWIIKRLFP